MHIQHKHQAEVGGLKKKFIMFVGEFWRKFIGCVSRHIDCTFPTCDLTTSIISLWPVDSGIKGCLWKASVSVWEQNGWPWHVMTVCHLWRLAQIIVTRALRRTTLLFPWNVGKHVLKSCIIWIVLRGIMALSEKDLDFFFFLDFFLRFAGCCEDVSEEAMPNYKMYTDGCAVGWRAWLVTCDPRSEKQKLIERIKFKLNKICPVVITAMKKQQPHQNNCRRFFFFNPHKPHLH